MKNIFILFSFLVSINSAIPVIAQNIKYIGTVEYKEEIVCNADGEGRDSDFRWNVKVDNIRLRQGTFNLIFTKAIGDDQTGMEIYTLAPTLADITLTDHSFAEGNTQASSCDRDGKKISPGHSLSSKYSSNRVAINRPVISGQLIFDAGKYSLLLMGDIRELLTSEEYHEEKTPCWGKSPPPSSFTFSEEIESPFGISVEKYYGNPRYLKGTHVIADTSSKDCNCVSIVSAAVHGDVDCSYSSNTTVSWTLIKKCEALGSVGKELDKRDLKPPTKARIKDMLSKLDNPATTNTHVFIGWYIISTVKDNDQAQKILNNKDEYMTDLRKLLNGYCEKSKDVKELTDLVIMTDKEIVDIVNRFNQQYLREHILTPGQVTIKDWIADQQRDPNSVYHSYADK